MKRILTFILAVAMTMTVLPVSVFARGDEYIEAEGMPMNEVEEEIALDDEDDGYYSELDGYNTLIYDEDDELVAKLFCPVEHFEVYENYVYYLYNREIYKYDIETSEETIVFTGTDAVTFDVDAEGTVTTFAAVDEVYEEYEVETAEADGFEADYYGDCNIADLVFIENPVTKKYIERRINSYIAKEKTIAESLNAGKLAYFFFEGGSDNFGKSGYNYDTERVFAVCIVVKRIAGVDTVIFASENSSTIPDMPRGFALNRKRTGWAAGTVMDGTYQFVTCNHRGFVGLNQRYNGTNEIPTVYLHKDGYEVYIGTGMNVHYRSSIHPTTCATNKSAWSEGCLLICNNFTNYNKYVEDVFSDWTEFKLGVRTSSSGYKSNLYYFTSKYDAYQTAQEYGGTVTIDRQLAKNELVDLYQNEDAIIALTEYSANVCPTCATAGTKAFNYNDDGECPDCDFVYNWQSTFTNDSSSVVVGTYTRNISKEYKKFYLRKSPYGNDANLIETKNYSSLEVLGLVKNADGGRWFKVKTPDNKEGYIVAYKVEACYDWQSPYGDSEITFNINEGDYPSGTIEPKSFGLGGTIESKYDIKLIKGEILRWKNMDECEVAQTATADLTNKGVKKYNIRSGKVNSNLIFGNLSDGAYNIRYSVWDLSADTSGAPTDYFETEIFSVAKQKPTSSALPTVYTNVIKNGASVTATCSDGSALIHISGGPNGERTGYSSVTYDITTPGSYTLNAWTTASGKTSSGKVTKTVYVSKVSAPYISDATYTVDGAYVTINGNGEVRYTTDGSTPTEWSLLYTGPIYLKSNQTVSAIAMSYGKVNSDITSKKFTLYAPDSPTIELTTANKIAQGESATVVWSKVDTATSYKAYLMLDGEEVESVTTTGTTATFVLPMTSEDENVTYKIKVVATNFVGDSRASNSVTVKAMHPLTVTVVDYILREGDVDDDVVDEIQARLDKKYGDEAPRVEDNIISVQSVPYGKKASKPATPSKRGFTFAGYSEELYDVITEDTEVQALYDVNYYTASFYDTEDGKRKNNPVDSAKYMYTECAAEPDVSELEVPDGYIFSGWFVDSGVSEGDSYTFMDGDVIMDASYSWEYEELPVYARIDSVVRDDRSYSVNIGFKNAPTTEPAGVQSRVIAALYTDEGKCVATQLHELDADFLGNTHNYDYTETITILYDEHVTSVSVYVVGVVDGKTSGTLSPVATTKDITLKQDSGFWGPWSDWTDEKITETDTRQVDTRTLYRYRDKEQKYILPSERSQYESWGWTYTGKRNENSEPYVYTTSSWMPQYYEDDTHRWEFSEPYYNKAQTKTQYRYGRWTNGSDRNFCPNRLYGSYMTFTQWYDTEVHTYNWNSSKNRPYMYCCQSYLGHSHTGDYNYKPDWFDDSDSTDCWYQRIVPGYEGYWYWVDTREVVTSSAYYSYYAHNVWYSYDYEKWSEWSEWENRHPGSNLYNERQIETKTQYAYRDVAEEANTAEEVTLFEDTKIITLDSITADLNGKRANVMVYKKTNTDPTEEQLEYISQVTIGDGNSFELYFNTREEPHYIGTGDFVVALAIEGSNKLVNIDYIEAPKPEYSVKFQNDLGEVFCTETVYEGDSIDVNTIGIPELSGGKRFLKWDKSLVNIKSDMTVSPITEAEKCSIVFVDYGNKTCDIVEYRYGDTIVTPVEPVREGYTFGGWIGLDGESETVVNGSAVLTADWVPNEYTVEFRDLNGDVVDTQTVCHGEAARTPDPIVIDGVEYSWDTTTAWWSVTHDIVVYPYISKIAEISSPAVNADLSEGGGAFYSDLSADEGSRIFYSYYDEITDEMAANYAENIRYEDEMADYDGYVDIEMQQIYLPMDGSNALVAYTDGEETTEEGDEAADEVGGDAYFEDYTDYILEYTEPIEISEGMVLYTFSIDEDYRVSPIAVYEYSYDDSEDAGIVPNEYEISPDCPVISISDTIAEPGETFTMPITVKNNPGVTHLGIEIKYDSNNFKVIDVTNGDVFADDAFTYDADYGNVYISGDSEAAVIADGVIAYVTFLASNNEGVYSFDLSVKGAVSADDDEQPFATIDSIVTNSARVLVLGDANGDGIVNFVDSAMLQRYLAHWSGYDASSVYLKALDLNGDGTANTADAMFLARHLASWEGYELTSAG